MYTQKHMINMKLEYWFPVLSLILGWLLNELGQLFRLRREERKAFGRAIADLLEIRHELKSFNVIFGEIKKRLPVSPNDEFVARKFLEDFIPQTENLQERYNEAVTLIASIDPLLGFRLRSKDQFKPFLRKLRPLLENDESTKSFIAQFEDKVSDKFAENLEKLILDLAKAHRWKTWWKVRRRFSKPEDISKEIDEMFALLIPKNKH